MIKCVFKLSYHLVISLNLMTQYGYLNKNHVCKYITKNLFCQFTNTHHAIKFRCLIMIMNDVELSVSKMMKFFRDFSTFHSFAIIYIFKDIYHILHFFFGTFTLLFLIVLDHKDEKYRMRL